MSASIVNVTGVPEVALYNFLSSSTKVAFSTFPNLTVPLSVSLFSNSPKEMAKYTSFEPTLEVFTNFKFFISTSPGISVSNNGTPP